MTLLELYEQSGGRLFDNMARIPFNRILGSQLSNMEKDPAFLLFRDNFENNLTSFILLKLGDFKVVYSDLDRMLDAIGSWSSIRASVWADLFRTTLQYYNLIHNTDKTEEHTDERIIDEKTDSWGESRSVGRGSGESESKVSAYDSTEYTPKDSANSKSVGVSDNASILDGKRKQTETFKHTVRAFGNIGVTTSQQMLREERDLVQFNIVEYIAEDFKREFCVMVY